MSAARPQSIAQGLVLAASLLVANALALGHTGTLSSVGIEAEVIARASRVAGQLPRAVATPITGAPLVRGMRDEALYLADEDHATLRVVPLPFDPQRRFDVPLPGPPAAALALDNLILVTVRDPGLLMAFEQDPAAGLREVARVDLPWDAWGLSVTADRSMALVSSPWSNRLSAVDLDSMRVRWSVETAREPRGVVIHPEGDRAYVSHLIGADLTRVELDRPEPELSRVRFPAAPLKTRADRDKAASLAYAPLLSPDGARLFLPRRALGGHGSRSWAGEPTVDVLLTRDDSSLAERPIDVPKPLRFRVDGDQSRTGPGVVQDARAFIQPRAAAYRAATQTLLIASEGTDQLVELDARSIDPSADPLRRYSLDDTDGFFFAFFRTRRVGVTTCGAPSGVALSADESTAYVFCRSTGDLAVVALHEAHRHERRLAAATAPRSEGVMARLHLADDVLDADAALGRRLFYDAKDTLLSEGFACAGCHPDGRDDGHVWHEINLETSTGRTVGEHGYLAFPVERFHNLRNIRGKPRQTPMLAGRVDAEGPFGWRGSEGDLPTRLISGMLNHRWFPDAGSTFGGPSLKGGRAVAAFLRQGLLRPPRHDGPLSKQQEDGRELFNDPMIGCASCHLPEHEYTDRVASRLPGSRERMVDNNFERAEPQLFRTPSLSYVAQTPPYFHDGRAATLEALITDNHDQMGLTAQLDDGEQAALLAFLRTL